MTAEAVSKHRQELYRAARWLGPIPNEAIGYCAWCGEWKAAELRGGKRRHTPKCKCGGHIRWGLRVEVLSVGGLTKAAAVKWERELRRRRLV